MKKRPAGTRGRSRGSKRRLPVSGSPAHSVGDVLLIEEEGCCFPCKVLEVCSAEDGVYLVHYIGWDDIRDEKVGLKCNNHPLEDSAENHKLCDSLVRRPLSNQQHTPTHASDCSCRSQRTGNGGRGGMMTSQCIAAA